MGNHLVLRKALGIDIANLVRPYMNWSEHFFIRHQNNYCSKDMLVYRGFLIFPDQTYVKLTGFFYDDDMIVLTHEKKPHGDTHSIGILVDNGVLNPEMPRPPSFNKLIYPTVPADTVIVAIDAYWDANRVRYTRLSRFLRYIGAYRFMKNRTYRNQGTFTVKFE